MTAHVYCLKHQTFYTVKCWPPRPANSQQAVKSEAVVGVDDFLYVSGPSLRPHPVTPTAFIYDLHRQTMKLCWQNESALGIRPSWRFYPVSGHAAAAVAPGDTGARRFFDVVRQRACHSRTQHVGSSGRPPPAGPRLSGESTGQMWLEDTGTCRRLL